MAELTATVLIDNIGDSPLVSEWGLAIYIEYQGKKILLDTGASGKFLKNADKMGINLAEVDFGALSHAHADHANGLKTFFECNEKAPFYLRQDAKEDCYGRKWFFNYYIGIRRGTLEKYRDRILFADGDVEVCPGATLVPHKTPNLDRIGRKANMYRRTRLHWSVDDFRHEQSLVFDTQKGLVIFNSCSHGGADNIIREVSETFPGKKIHAIIGGFHLFESSQEDVLAFARRVKDTGIEKVITGHCTGQKAFDLLKSELGGSAQQLYTGMRIEI